MKGVWLFFVALIVAACFSEFDVHAQSSFGLNASIEVSEEKGLFIADGIVLTENPFRAKVDVEPWKIMSTQPIAGEGFMRQIFDHAYTTGMMEESVALRRTVSCSRKESGYVCDASFKDRGRKTVFFETEIYNKYIHQFKFKIEDADEYYGVVLIEQDGNAAVMIALLDEEYNNDDIDSIWIFTGRGVVFFIPWFSVNVSEHEDFMNCSPRCREVYNSVKDENERLVELIKKIFTNAANKENKE